MDRHDVASSAAALPGVASLDADGLASMWRDLRAAGWLFVAFVLAGFVASAVLLVVVVVDGVHAARVQQTAGCVDDDPLRAPYMPTVGVAPPRCR